MDDFFSDFDSVDLEAIDAIEALHNPASNIQATLAKPAKPQQSAEDSFQFSDEIDIEQLEVFESQIQQSRASSSRVTQPTTLRQTTLDGSFLPPRTSSPRKATNNPFGNKISKTLSWDHTAFAKSGWRNPNPKPKNSGNDFEEEEEDEVEDQDEGFEQFPAVSKFSETFIDITRPPPANISLEHDAVAARQWIFPNNLSKRDYQFNIIKRCLFDNTLVALPTGLGKTFIAGVLMLNYYRWFPEGKIVFVAPTRPLVAQQISACHELCGIPGRDAAELTGRIARSARSKLWHEKRVIFATPQTFINDLIHGICDPQSVVLLVIDEAHKGTGEYAYAQIVRYMMAKNPFFRLLALTATPGGTPDAVQNIINCLHISHIEIRDENSMDIRPYVHKKEIKQHLIAVTGSIKAIQSALIKLMEAKYQPLRSIINIRDMTTLSPYYCQQTMLSCPHFWAKAGLKTLGSLARAMDYLIHYSASMCYNTLQDIAHGIVDDPEAPAKKSTTKKSGNSKLAADPLFQNVMKTIEEEKLNGGGLIMHPKLEKLQALMLDHFVDADGENTGNDGEARSTRAIVFITYRPCVDEVVTMLEQCRPMIRAERFVGQSDTKKSGKGKTQKEQIDAIRRFKAGEINCLVSTAIGEEGLDIGEVDLIVCYDVQKSPLRVLQRVGRTGRKRDGKVDFLAMEGREQHRLKEATDAYRAVQHSIVAGRSLELYGDVHRLLPENVKPECLEMFMEIEQYVPEEPKGKKAAASKGTKRKRNDDPERNVPVGAASGFVPAGALVTKGRKKQKLETSKDFSVADLEDDEDDMMIQAGLVAPARERLEPTVTKASKKKKVPLEKVTPPRTKPIPKATSPSVRPTPDSPIIFTASQLARAMDDDEDEIDFLLESIDAPRKSTPKKQIEAFSSPSSERLSQSDDLSFERPVPSRSECSSVSNRSIVSAGQASAKASFSYDDSDDDVVVLDPPPIRRASLKLTSSEDDDVEIVDDAPPRPRSNIDMPPPPPAPPPNTIYSSPDSSFPVRPRGHIRRRAAAAETTDDESMIQESSVGKSAHSNQLFLSPDSPAPLPSRTKRPKASLLNDNNRYLAIEADLSGDDAAGGSSDTDGIESESDRAFAGNFMATQAPAGYNQDLVYRQSLFTQAPKSAPVFASAAVRRGGFNFRRAPARAPDQQLSSSPRRMGDTTDEYEMDSFVVGDEEELLQMTSSSQ